MIFEQKLLKPKKLGIFFIKFLFIIQSKKIVLCIRHTTLKGDDDHLKSTRSRVIVKEKAETPIEVKDEIRNDDDDDFLEEEEMEEEIVIEVKKSTSERWGELLAETQKIIAKTISEKIPTESAAPIKTDILKNLEKLNSALEW